jgi:hypothetical protein
MTPAWSWDNLRIAMARRRPYGNGTTNDIYVVNRDGSNATVRPPRTVSLGILPGSGGSRIVLSVRLKRHLAT